MQVFSKNLLCRFSLVVCATLIFGLKSSLSFAEPPKAEPLKSEAEVEIFEPHGTISIDENNHIYLNEDRLPALDNLMLVLKYSSPEIGYSDKILLKMHRSVKPETYMPLKELLDERGYTARLYIYSSDETQNDSKK